MVLVGHNKNALIDNDYNAVINDSFTYVAEPYMLSAGTYTTYFYTLPTNQY